MLGPCIENLGNQLLGLGIDFSHESASRAAKVAFEAVEKLTRIANHSPVMLVPSCSRHDVGTWAFTAWVFHQIKHPRDLR